jgi:hypothetical protein
MIRKAGIDCVDIEYIDVNEKDENSGGVSKAFDVGMNTCVFRLNGRGRYK